jgi:hypothetical protein
MHLQAVCVFGGITGQTRASRKELCEDDLTDLAAGGKKPCLGSVSPSSMIFDMHYVLRVCCFGLPLSLLPELP